VKPAAVVGGRARLTAVASASLLLLGTEAPGLAGFSTTTASGSRLGSVYTASQQRARRPLGQAIPAKKPVHMGTATPDE
jgi:hypothetical protein